MEHTFKLKLRKNVGKLFNYYDFDQPPVSPENYNFTEIYQD